jgi:hypothetical protein
MLTNAFPSSVNAREQAVPLSSSLTATHAHHHISGSTVVIWNIAIVSERISEAPTVQISSGSIHRWKAASAFALSGRDIPKTYRIDL